MRIGNLNIDLPSVGKDPAQSPKAEGTGLPTSSVQTTLSQHPAKPGSASRTFSFLGRSSEHQIRAKQEKQSATTFISAVNELKRIDSPESRQETLAELNRPDSPKTLKKVVTALWDLAHLVPLAGAAIQNPEAKAEVKAICDAAKKLLDKQIGMSKNKNPVTLGSFGSESGRKTGFLDNDWNSIADTLVEVGELSRRSSAVVQDIVKENPRWSRFLTSDSGKGKKERNSRPDTDKDGWSAASAAAPNRGTLGRLLGKFSGKEQRRSRTEAGATAAVTAKVSESPPKLKIDIPSDAKGETLTEALAEVMSKYQPNPDAGREPAAVKPNPEFLDQADGAHGSQAESEQGSGTVAHVSPAPSPEPSSKTLSAAGNLPPRPASRKARFVEAENDLSELGPARVLDGKAAAALGAVPIPDPGSMARLEPQRAELEVNNASHGTAPASGIEEPRMRGKVTENTPLWHPQPHYPKGAMPGHSFDEVQARFESETALKRAAEQAASMEEHLKKVREL